MTDRTSVVSGLLQAWGAGDLRARDDLVPLVYRELRRRAAGYLRHERPGHTLAPTALVHEAYLRPGVTRCGIRVSPRRLNSGRMAGLGLDKIHAHSRHRSIATLMLYVDEHDR